MTATEIVSKVKALRLPYGSYVVYGSGPLAAAGIRETNDVDLLVSSQTLRELAARGWKRQIKGPGDAPLTWDVFEAHDTWAFSIYSPTLKELLETATVIDGVPFASLEHVRLWKEASGRPKDLTDLALIEAYQSQQR